MREMELPEIVARLKSNSSAERHKRLMEDVFDAIHRGRRNTIEERQEQPRPKRWLSPVRCRLGWHRWESREYVYTRATSLIVMETSQARYQYALCCDRIRVLITLRNGGTDE